MPDEKQYYIKGAMYSLDQIEELSKTDEGSNMLFEAINEARAGISVIFITSILQESEILLNQTQHLQFCEVIHRVCFKMLPEEILLCLADLSEQIQDYIKKNEVKNYDC